MKWPTIYRHYRCRNIRCRHEWTRTSRCTPMVAAFGDWQRDESKCPKCGKRAQPSEMGEAMT
jgi:hypothetical protein